MSKILEDEETMNDLGKIEFDQIDTYININKLINYLDIILETDEEHEGIIINDGMKDKIYEFSGINVENESLDKGDIKEILSIVKLSLSAIDIENILLKRLLAVLEIAGIELTEEETLIKVYEAALSVSQFGYKIVHKRDISEIYVNNYNKEWIINWNANMDLQICLDYFGLITYISDYFTKDDTGTLQFIKDALNKAPNECLRKKLSIVIDTFLTHRQIGESEGFFRILPHLELKYSNIESIFMPTGFKTNRSKFLKQITEDEAKYAANVIQVENSDGFYTEAISLIDKYERRDCSENECLKWLTYIQFCMKYVPTNTKPKPEELKTFAIKRDTKGWDIDEEMDLIVTHDFKISDYHFPLPKYIKLNDVGLGEQEYMRKRSRRVIRIHKLNSTGW